MANEAKLDALVKKAAKPAEDKTLAGRFGQTELEQFARALLAKLDEQAFGAMPKRELELFIFHLLSRAEKLRSLNTYEWANLLHISESRIRSLRADAALRFVVMDNQSALTEIARQFCSAGKTCMEYDENESRIKLLLDDPSLQRVFECANRLPRKKDSASLGFGIGIKRQCCTIFGAQSGRAVAVKNIIHIYL